VLRRGGLVDSIADVRPEPVLSTPASAGLLVACLLVVTVVAAVGGVSTADAVQQWYPTLSKPPWTPPNWAFGPIWTVLYTAMAVAAWDVLRRGFDRRALALTVAQISLNFVWSPLFFGLHWVWSSLVVMSLLFVTVAACIGWYGRFSRVASALMVPYLVWIGIAWSLNAWIVAFNPGA